MPIRSGYRPTIRADAKDIESVVILPEDTDLVPGKSMACVLQVRLHIRLNAKSETSWPKVGAMRVGRKLDLHEGGRKIGQYEIDELQEFAMERLE